VRHIIRKATMILKTRQALGPLHGFGIARRIEQLSESVLTLNEGTLRLQVFISHAHQAMKPNSTAASRTYSALDAAQTY
jgi:hypothetical protein